MREISSYRRSFLDGFIYLEDDRRKVLEAFLLHSGDAIEVRMPGHIRFQWGFCRWAREMFTWTWGWQEGSRWAYQAIHTGRSANEWHLDVGVAGGAVHGRIGDANAGNGDIRHLETWVKAGWR